MSFEKAFERTIIYEGGYSDNPYDSGGKTMYGITEKTARDNGYKGKMKDLTLREAKEIYKDDYWNIIRLDEIDKESMQELMFDTAVNMGVHASVLFAQRAYNILNKKGIAVDGVIGPQTINAINNYRYERDIAFWYISVRVEGYNKIVKSNEDQKVFIRGWGRRIQSLLDEVVL
jgi:lysozyme family protein